MCRSGEPPTPNLFRLLVCADVAAEIKLILATIYTSFTTAVLDDTGIEQEDAYTARPRGHTLVVRVQAAPPPEENLREVGT